MKALIVMNAYPNGEKFYRQSRRIAEELEKAGAETEIRLCSEVKTAVCADGSVEVPAGFDFAVYLDKDKYLGRMLEKAGWRLFNRAEAVESCDDKMLTYLALSGAGIPVPETIPAPLCYTPGAVADSVFLARAAHRLGFPLIVKKSYGSFGKDVRLAYDMRDMRAIAEEFLYLPHFYQKYIAESTGRDVRVIVVGGKAVAAMERRAKMGEFRSNIELGGTGRVVTLSQEFREVAETAARCLALDYCGIDILEGKDGPVLCEVNSNAFFEGMEGATGINIAKLYVEYMLKSVRGQ